MEIHSSIRIQAPARKVWTTLGERFAHVGEWAAPITSSCAVGDAEPGVGVERICHVSGFGPVKPGVIRERLLAFDPVAMRFEYQAVDGMPKFVKHAINRWHVQAVDSQTSIVYIHATLKLSGFMRLFAPLMGWQFRIGGGRVAEELKFFIEQGKPHPRKSAEHRSNLGTAG